MIVKICGVTTVDDARAALAAGADWIGLNLVAGPRRIDPDTAAHILSRLDDPGRAVGLVALAQGSSVPPMAATLLDHGVRRLQLYGEVTPEAVGRCRAGGFETIVAWPVEDEASLTLLDEFLGACLDARPSFVLFDAATWDRLGGTGQPANWAVIAGARQAGRFAAWPPVLLAGGLTPDNVADAVAAVLPVGVDVSSGVESQPGSKDPAKVKAFIAAARRGEKCQDESCAGG